MASIIPPTSIVILGGTGNLAETKLLPALFDLYVRAVLPSAFVIVGLSRKLWLDDDYVRYVAEAVTVARPHASPTEVASFAALARYAHGDFDSAETYHRVRVRLQEIDGAFGQCTNKLFYLAVPPQFYSSIFSNLAQSGVMTLCNSLDSWSRLLVEKPFGRDLATAQALEAQLCALFAEEQIYRIDHYLAKDAIENIIALRFGNRVFADSWQHTDIESIAVRMLETKDVSTRGSFYDGIGALRDVGQNHLLQILALLTMTSTPPGDIAAMRSARARIIGALLPPRTFVRGQYDGYVDTTGVAPDSQTETYFKLITELDLPEWSGVPFTLEAGKALNEARIDAVITFRAASIVAADTTPSLHQNVLTITIAPESRITVRVFVKRPGFAFTLEPRELELVHTPGVDDYSPEAYERVLYDCLLGDQTRFVSGAEVEAAWRFITPLLDPSLPPPLRYAPGTSGPESA
jgi:glucose-6-phosphate 1-dehydrogenase